MYFYLLRIGLLYLQIFYTVEDYEWIVQATPQEVMDRYQLRREYVKTFINRSRAILDKIENDSEDHIITVGQAFTDT